MNSEHMSDATHGATCHAVTALKFRLRDVVLIYPSLVLCTDTPPGRLPKPERSFFDLYFITFGRLNRALLIHQLSPPVVQGAVIHGESAYVSRLVRYLLLYEICSRN